MSFADDLRNISSKSSMEREEECFRNFIRRANVVERICSKIQSSCRMAANEGHRSVRVTDEYFIHMYREYDIAFRCCHSVGGIFSKRTIKSIVIAEELAPKLTNFCDKLGLNIKSVGGYFESGGSDAPDSYIFYADISW